MTENEEEISQARYQGLKLTRPQYNQALQWAVVKGSSSMVENIFEMSPSSSPLEGVVDYLEALDEETIRLGLQCSDLKVVTMFLNKVDIKSLPSKTQRLFLFDKTLSPPPIHLEFILDNVSLSVQDMLYWLSQRSHSALWSVTRAPVSSFLKKILKSVAHVPDPSLIKMCLHENPSWAPFLWEECVARNTQKELLVVLFTQALTAVSEKKHAKQNQKILSNFIGQNIESVKPHLSQDQLNKLVRWNEKGSPWLPVFLKCVMTDNLSQMPAQPSRAKKM